MSLFTFPSFRRFSILSIVLLILVPWIGLSAVQVYYRDGVSNYSGTEDFYTYRIDGGVFNSKNDLDERTLKVAPMESDTKFAIRFSNLGLSRSSYSSVNRITLTLTFKEAPTADTLYAHNLFDRNVWHERYANYNTINGSSPWQGSDGKMVDAWPNTDAMASVNGSESIDSTITFVFHPGDPSSCKALLDSWLDGNNQGLIIEGMSGVNVFYSSEAFNLAQRPELMIDYNP